MQQYLDLMTRILDEGRMRGDRTGTGTLGVFGHQMRFDLREGFPLVTTKRVFFNGVVEELLWFLRGETHVGSLQAAGVKIWDAWATPEQCARFGRAPGELGPVYGHQWRNFGATPRMVPNDMHIDTCTAVDSGVASCGMSMHDGFVQAGYERDGFDQISWVVNEIMRNPNSRRLIVSAWNPREAFQVTLPPCHSFFQFHVHDGELSCQVYQRSGDVFLGVPFNVASYALLTHMVAQATDLRVGDLVHTLGDAHLYLNHLDQAHEQLSRSPRPLPTLRLNPSVRDVLGFKASDVELIGYDPHPAIKAPVSV